MFACLCAHIQRSSVLGSVEICCIQTTISKHDKKFLKKNLLHDHSRRNTKQSVARSKKQQQTKYTQNRGIKMRYGWGNTIFILKTNQNYGFLLFETFYFSWGVGNTPPVLSSRRSWMFWPRRSFRVIVHRSGWFCFFKKIFENELDLQKTLKLIRRFSHKTTNILAKNIELNVTK